MVTDDATDITPTTAVLNGRMTWNGREDADHVYFDWDTDSGEPYAHTEDLGPGGEGSHEKEITGLAQGTPHYFRIRAHNSKGESLGAEKTFTTFPVAPTMVTHEADEITATGAKLHGEVQDTGMENPTRYLDWYLGYVLDDSESFEVNLGDWANVAEFPWERHSGTTPSNGCGPNSAYDGSYYIFVECSSPGCYNIGDTAIIEYLVSPAAKGYVDCHHLMYGGNMGDLFLEAYDGSEWSTIWSKSGQQSLDGDDWKHEDGSVAIFPAGTEKIRFRYVAAGEFEADPALDLVKVYVQEFTAEDCGVGGVGLYEAAIAGLTPETTYYFRARGVNSAGTGVGAEKEFTTLAA
ncbi:hypothetical protein ES703_53267 [subsurface metagenome]